MRGEERIVRTEMQKSIWPCTQCLAVPWVFEMGSPRLKAQAQSSALMGSRAKKT